MEPNTELTIDEMIDALLQVGGINEVWHRTTFRCYRNDRNGVPQGLTVEILDRGRGADPRLRYACNVRTEDGKESTGNAEATIDMALRVVHWNALDVEPWDGRVHRK